jgi:hypothetical protein
LQFAQHPEISLHIANARGSVKYPLSDLEIEKKFLDLSDKQLSKTQARALIDAIWNLDNLPDVSLLMQLAQITAKH